MPIKKKMTVDLGLLGEHSITITVGTQLKVSVRARDNVGLKWVEFRIEGRGKEKVRFAEGVNNSTATAYFECDLLGSVFFGYDLNITVCDRNGNAGYLEQHINSMLENFVAWVLGAVTALAKFVMELASAAIEWVWDFITSTISSVCTPLIENCKLYLHDIVQLINQSSQYHDENGVLPDDASQEIEKALFSPFFTNIFVITLIILLILSILQYFLTWLAWLLTGIVIFILVAFLALLVDCSSSIEANTLTNDIKAEQQNKDLKLDINSLMSNLLPDISEESRNDAEPPDHSLFTLPRFSRAFYVS